MLRISVLITSLLFFLCAPSTEIMCNDTISTSSMVKELLHQVDHAVSKNRNHNAHSYSQSIQTIVIDPGHGGKDHGCRGKNSREKTIVLEVSKMLGKKINENYPEIKVIYTRVEDKFIPLHKRAEIANSNNADLFISIHCNYVPNKSYVYGSETYVMGLHRAEDNLAVAKRENSVVTLEENYKENYEGFDPNSPESHIIQSMYQNAFLEQSITFANYLEHEFVKSKNRKSRGVKQAGFLVLRRTTMPSVLVELGFLSNRREENYLLSRNGQKQVTTAFIKAFENYNSYLQASETKRKEKADMIAEKVDKKVKVEKKKDSENNYTIQLIATTEQIPKSHVLYSDIDELKEVKAGKYFKYFIGEFEEEEKAELKLNELKKSGYKDAFITVLKK